MSNSFLQAAAKRRSIYALDKNINHSDNDIISTIEQAMLVAPSAFGAQPTRTLVLLHQQHDTLWDMVESQLKKVVAAEHFAATAQKIASFRAGYGTILFFEDQTVIKSLQEKFAAYADNFPVWGLQAQGIAVYSIWTALASAGIGASIQHYNPLIDNDVKNQWQIPESWTLLGQMPFGNIASPAAEKAAIDISELVKVAK